MVELKNEFYEGTPHAASSTLLARSVSRSWKLEKQIVF